MFKFLDNKTEAQHFIIAACIGLPGLVCFTAGFLMMMEIDIPAFTKAAIEYDPLPYFLYSLALVFVLAEAMVIMKAVRLKKPQA